MVGWTRIIWNDAVIMSAGNNKDSFTANVLLGSANLRVVQHFR